MKQMHKNVKTALETMCRYANVIFDEVDWTSDDWYSLHSWTHEQEESYRAWWCEFVKTNWQGILTCKPYRHKELSLAWSMWNLNYGWKIKEANDE